MYFSDVYADQDLPEEIRKHKVLWGEMNEIFVEENLSMFKTLQTSVFCMGKI